MCGRYVSPDEAALERYWDYKFDGSFKGIGNGRAERVNYNTCPTQMVPVEIINDRGEPEIVMMRWGMDRIDPATGEISPKKLNNARYEGYTRVRPFADAWKAGRRCIQLVMGYYEWMVREDGKKVPYYIRPSDQGETFGLAGLYHTAADGTLACAHITLPPNAVLARIHERMPAILRFEDHHAWLKGDPKAAYACVQAYPAELTELTRVSPRVSQTRNNDAALIEPYDEDAEEKPREETQEKAVGEQAPMAKAKKEKAAKAQPEKKNKDDGQAGFDF